MELHVCLLSHGAAPGAQVSKKDWMESVKLVFDYFCERTPRSFVELRETSVVWNYKYADVEFGRLQARDLLQHLWTGPISNAPVDIVQVLSGSPHRLCIQALRSLLHFGIPHPMLEIYAVLLHEHVYLIRCKWPVEL